MEILIINGPNMNLLAERNPGVYGNKSFEDYFKTLEQTFQGHNLSYFQSNSEGAIIDKLHEVHKKNIGIVLNPAAYSHTSYAISDAIEAISNKVVEVHISNIYAREQFRDKSVTAVNCVGVITGLGLEGYRLAIDFLLKQ